MDDHGHGHGPGGHGHGHGHGHHHGGRRHGNPEDLAAYVGRLDDPERDAWQRPEELLAALAIPAGATVAEIGSGSGYFTMRLAGAVGPEGRVLAVDVEPELLALLRDRLGAAGVSNVTPILALPGDPFLPDRSCALILSVNTFHHLPEPPAYLRRLARALAPTGRLLIVDFERDDSPVGPPPEERVSREDFLATVQAAGLAVLDELTFLPHQYAFLLGERTD